MSDMDRSPESDAPLNPALKSAIETSVDTDRVTPAPIDTASAKAGEGEGWPIIWLAVAAACVALTAYLIF